MIRNKGRWERRGRRCVASCATLLVASCTEGAPVGERLDGPEQQESAEIVALAAGAQLYEGPAAKAPLPALNTGEPNSEASFSTFIQLGEAPKNISRVLDAGYLEETRWKTLVAGDAYTTPPMLATQLERALQAMHEHSSSTNVLYNVLSVLSKVLPHLDGSTSGNPRAVAYRPERARWTSFAMEGSEGGNYPPPKALEELRGRGERLYCAATNAYLQANSQPNSKFLGKQDIVSIPLPGSSLPILRVEPTLTVERPQRFDSGRNDGAQAFALPFQAGVRASLFPGIKEGIPIGEMTMPVTAVAADSELATPVDYGNGSRRKYATATHAMAFGGSSFDASAETNDIRLGQIGPIKIYATLGLEGGMTSCSEHGSYFDCRSEPARQVGRTVQLTQDGAGAPLTPFGVPARYAMTSLYTSGATTPANGDHSEQPWTVDTKLWQATVPGLDTWFPTRLPDPLGARMVQDNDKSFVVETKYGLAINFGATAGVRIPEDAKNDEMYVDISADVKAGFTLATSVLHRFREQEEIMARRAIVQTPEFSQELAQGVPQTAFTVTPGVQLEPIELKLVGSANIAVHIPVFSIPAFHMRIFKIGTTYGDAAHPRWWKEDRRLRLTTMQSYEGKLEDGVTSHLPGGSAYATFQDRAACAAPQPNAPPAYVPCDPEPLGTGAPIDLPICAVLPVREVAPDSDRDPELGCFLKVQPWFRTGTSLEQTFQGKRVIAHVLKSSSDWQQSATAVADCAGEYARLQSNVSAVSTFLQYVACDASGRLLDAPIAPSYNLGDPEPGSSAGACRR